MPAFFQDAGLTNGDGGEGDAGEERGSSSFLADRIQLFRNERILNCGENCTGPEIVLAGSTQHS